MSHRLLSLIKPAPTGFKYSPTLTQKDIRRWPFALLAENREAAELALAPFGTSLAGIIVTFGPVYSWQQCDSLLFHLTVPRELHSHLEALLHTQLELVETCQQTENRYVGQTLKLLRACEESQRNKNEFTLIKESLVEELAVRRRVEEALQESEAHFRLLTENVADVVWKLDKDYRFTYISPADERLRGYRADEVIGHHIFELFNEEGIATITRLAQQRIEAERNGISVGPVTFEAQHRCKDGRWIWAEISTTTERDVDGAVIGFHGITREITVRKQTEELLESNNTFLNALLDAIPVPVFYKDEELNYLGINKTFEQYYGMARQNMIGKSVYGFAPKELADVYHAKDMELLLNPGQQIYESQIRNAQTGNLRDVIFHKATFSDKKGNVRGMVGAILDITDRKNLEREQLKNEKLESLGVLAGGIAHDFNNILTGIMGNISFAQMFLDVGHKAHKPLVDAEKASVRATELAQQLLTFARGGEPVKKVVSLQQLVNETVTLVLHGSNVKGNVDISDSIHAIEADEGQMSQVFHNIIINATQAMPGGGTLSVGAQNETLTDKNMLSLPAGSYVRITFSDQGCGISEDNLKKIFDPYFTTKLTGNGLGLASVHSIVTRHGGHISAGSVIGTGTTFTIYLPSIGKQYTTVQSNRDSMTTGDHTSGTILIMDDEEMIRDMTAEMLDYLGYQATTCTNGSEAIELYTAARQSGTPFSAVIMDLTIPGGMGGKEAAEHILIADPKACLIVSSGYSNDPVMADFRSFGFVGAAAKPYNIKEFGQMLSSALAGR